MLEFRTQGYNGYAVKYSPFFDSRLAVSASMNFGLVGNGRLYILNLTPNGIVAEQTHVHPASQPCCGSTTDGAIDMIPKTPSSIPPGPRPMRTRSSSAAATAPSSSSTSPYRSSPCRAGRSTSARCSACTGTSSPRTHSPRVHGTEPSRSCAALPRPIPTSAYKVTTTQC